MTQPTLSVYVRPLFKRACHVMSHHVMLQIGHGPLFERKKRTVDDIITPMRLIGLTDSILGNIPGLGAMDKE